MSERFRFPKILTVKNHGRAELLAIGYLDQRRVFRHDNCCRYAEQFTLVSQCLRVITRRSGNHTTLLLIRRQLRQRVTRAALVANQIARDAEFFSFGTNDLTQTTLGMSRDDSGSFLPAYAELDIVESNPFASIDQNGVGRLMEITRDLGRKTRPDIKLGICGEHGGEPASVKFCHRLGLDYVSCSPFRIPIARLAAAQAALES